MPTCEKATYFILLRMLPSWAQLCLARPRSPSLAGLGHIRAELGVLETNLRSRWNAGSDRSTSPVMPRKCRTRDASHRRMNLGFSSVGRPEVHRTSDVQLLRSDLLSFLVPFLASNLLSSVCQTHGASDVSKAHVRLIGAHTSSPYIHLL